MYNVFMRLVNNPSYKHSPEEIKAFKKYSDLIFQKDYTQYSPEMIENLFYIMTQIKKYGIKKDSALWLTKNLWEKGLSKSEISVRYLPIVMSAMVLEHIMKKQEDDEHDINEIYSLESLEEIEYKLRGYEVTEKEIGIIYEDDLWFVSRPSSINASIFAGIDTHWCTANSDFFSNHYIDYLINGIDLFFIIKKGGNTWKNSNDKLSIGFRDGKPSTDSDTNKQADDKDIDEDIEYIVGNQRALEIYKAIKRSVVEKNQLLKEFEEAAVNINKYKELEEKYVNMDIDHTKFLSCIVNIKNVKPEVMNEVLNINLDEEDYALIVNLSINYSTATKKLIFEKIGLNFFYPSLSDDLSSIEILPNNELAPRPEGSIDELMVINKKLKLEHEFTARYFTARMIKLFITEKHEEIIELLKEEDIDVDNITKETIFQMFMKWYRK